MLKKLLLVGGIILVGSWAVGSGVCRDVASYARTGWKEFRQATKKAVPVEFEIKRAEDLLSNLDKTDDRLITSLASHIHMVKAMERDVETMQANLDRAKEDLRVRNDEMKTQLTSNTKGVARDQKALELEIKFKSFKTMEATVKTKKETLDNYRERLEAIKAQREGLKAQRGELATRIEKLKNDLEYLKVAETRNRSKLQGDQLADLAQLKTLVESLENRIETTLIEHQLRQQERPAVEGKKDAAGSRAMPNLTQEIDSHLSDAKVAQDK
jgi:chromosome segregation ATPase